MIGFDAPRGTRIDELQSVRLREIVLGAQVLCFGYKFGYEMIFVSEYYIVNQ